MTNPALWRSLSGSGYTLSFPFRWRWRAWLLARRDDRDAYGPRSRALIAADPADFAALTRLAALESTPVIVPKPRRFIAPRPRSTRPRTAPQILVADSGYAPPPPSGRSRCDRLGRRVEAWGWSHLTAPTPPSPSKSANTATLRDDLAAVGLSPAL